MTKEKKSNQSDWNAEDWIEMNLDLYHIQFGHKIFPSLLSSPSLSLPPQSKGDWKDYIEYTMKFSESFFYIIRHMDECISLLQLQVTQSLRVQCSRMMSDSVTDTPAASVDEEDNEVARKFIEKCKMWIFFSLKIKKKLYWHTKYLASECIWNKTKEWGYDSGFPFAFC